MNNDFPLARFNLSTRIELAIIGFRPLKSDSCVYIYKNETSFVVPTLYVDDIVFLSASAVLLNKFKTQLMNRFEVSGMTDVSKILGINVTRDREKWDITIIQTNYTGDVVQRYGLEGCNPAYTPNVGSRIPLNQSENTLLDEEETWCFQVITGAVIYLPQVTRYDILHAISHLARTMSNTAKAHLGAAKHLPRDLAVSTDFFITYT